MPTVSLNVPHYRQELGNSCLAACVRMVLAYHGLVHSEHELRHLLGTGPRGTRARDVARVAALGLHAEVRFSNVAELGAALVAGNPPIVFVDTGDLDYWSIDCPHVAVLTGLDAAAVLLNDPYFDSAPRQVSLASFQQAWAKNAHLAAFLRRKA